MRPRGTPPMPSATSSGSEPVGIASTLTARRRRAASASPAPNSLLDLGDRGLQGLVLGLGLLRRASFKSAFLICHLLITSLPTSFARKLQLGQRLVHRHPAAGGASGRASSVRAVPDARTCVRSAAPAASPPAAGLRPPCSSGRTRATVRCGQNGRFSGSWSRAATSARSTCACSATTPVRGRGEREQPRPLAARHADRLGRAARSSAPARLDARVRPRRSRSISFSACQPRKTRVM